MQHLSTGITVTLPVAPLPKLTFEIVGGLSRQGRMRRPRSASVRAVTLGTGGNVTTAIALVIQSDDDIVARGFVLSCHDRWHGQAFVIGSDLLSRRIVETVGDPAHLLVAPRAARIAFELAQDETVIQPGKTRHEVAIAFSLETVAGRTGTLHLCISPAQRDHFSRRFEVIEDRLPLAACAEQEHDRRRGRKSGEKLRAHRLKKRYGRNYGSLCKAALAGASLALAACKPPAEMRYEYDEATRDAGLVAIEKAGCGACHAIPGLSWPQGSTGPSLENFDGAGPIAGAVPNTPENLAAFVRNAPSVKPGSTMPPMPLDEIESRAVAAYLYGLGDD